jgi:hypothetical protein
MTARNLDVYGTYRAREDSQNKSAMFNRLRQRGQQGEKTPGKTKTARYPFDAECQIAFFSTECTPLSRPLSSLCSLASLAENSTITGQARCAATHERRIEGLAEDSCDNSQSKMAIA